MSTTRESVRQKFRASRSTVRTAARYFGMANLAVDLAGFVGPLVTGNRDRTINVRPGTFLIVYAINLLHTLCAAIGPVFALRWNAG